MWRRQERPLALLLIMALCYKAAVTEMELDMAPNAVDDQYTECRDEMLKKVVNSGLLTEELSSNKGFSTAWNANKDCAEPFPTGIKEHTQALLTYVFGGRGFQNSFNNAVETMGSNDSVYEKNFHYKSLHFLLMDSVTLLKQTQCKTVFFVTGRKYNVKVGSEVRLGRFTSAHQGISELLEDPDLRIMFNVTSCSALNLMENSCMKDGDTEFLLSPAEVFSVEKVNRVNNDDYEYTEVVLKHVRIQSDRDCHLFPRSPSGSSTHLGSMMAVLMAVFLCLFTC